MTTLAAPVRAVATTGGLLVLGVSAAAVTEAIAGTVLALGRGDILGDVHATPDEFAWLDIGYTAMKFVGFLLAPWALGFIRPRSLIIAATLTMGIACLLAAMSTGLGLLVALRIVQGLAGGLLLVAGQTLLFQAFPREKQPLVQAVFALGAVVAPATLTPALQGWLIDTGSWTWVFLSVVPVSLGAAGLLVLTDDDAPRTVRRPLDIPGLVLVGVTLVCVIYVFSQGSRWNWFEAPRIVWLSLIGGIALVAFIARQIAAGQRGLLDYRVFRTADFAFAFLVSFVAGAALFGSAYLIPSFAVSVLAFTPTDAGLLLLPGGAVFVASILLAASLMQARGAPPISTVPFGVASIMVAMWMLSRSTGESGSADMTAALVLRGFGLGLLFLSITLIAFSALPRKALASGIALFNTGRQLGGLMGVAGLQTLIDHQTAANQAVLAANVTAGLPQAADRLAATTQMLIARGVDAGAAGRAATSVLGRAVTGQSTVIAFDTAFNALALVFVFAAPVVIAVKILLARSAAARGRPEDPGVAT